MDGKAMIVCMSRRICADLYRELIALRPEWHDADDEKGALKFVITGSAADPVAWQPHIRNKSRREALANRFRDVSDPFRIVIVRDMWLTGFDGPSLHTMYIDKPMRGHGLMQALATYTESGGTGQTAIDQSKAVAAMLEKYEVCLGLFHGFDLGPLAQGTAQQRISMIPAGQEFILAQERGKERLLQAVKELSEAFALAVPDDEALRIRDEVAFFQAVRAQLIKGIPDGRKPPETLDHAIRQIVSKALVSDEIVDIFAAAGLKKPASQSCPTNFSAKSAACRSATSRSSCCAAFWLEKSRPDRRGASCRRAPSRNCWNDRSADTRTARSRPRR